MDRRHALYPGTFDPVTLGHLDILERALALFDQVTVAVSKTSRANFLPLAERIALLQQATHQHPRCRVVALEGLLVDELRRQEAGCVVRGLRSVADFENERAQATLNGVMLGDCEFVYLLARPQLAAVCSSLVREIAWHGGPVEHFVPPPVAAALQQRQGGRRS